MTDENVIDLIPEGKIYSLKSVTIATFLASLIAGGFMMSHNYKVFGDRHKARMTWLVIIAGFLLILSTAFLPAFDRIPSIVFSAFTTIGINLACRRLQEKQMAAHTERGGEVYSGGAVATVILVCIIFMIAFLLLPYLLRDFVVGQQL